MDFSGDGLEVIDPTTGEVRVAKLFVAVLGASNLTYVEPVFTEELPIWIACHVHMARLEDDFTLIALKRVSA